MIEVSVVIPTKNRAGYIGRALKSVYDQTITNIEIIVVDDGSNDNTEEIINIHKLNEKVPIRFIKNEKSVGGAVARNQGAKIAKGRYIAFLDSDDQWLPEHLEKGLFLLKEKKCHGIYGSFFIEKADGIRREENVQAKPANISMAEYIFSSLGDTRTSTFIFDSKCFKEVLFDENQDKHQDWDLAIRFDQKYELIANTNKTVVIHQNVNNRMSSKMNHAATSYLLKKHAKYVSKKALQTFYINLTLKTIYIEGKTEYFYRYAGYVKRLSNEHSIKLSKKNLIKMCLTKLPRPLFLLVYNAYLNFRIRKSMKE